VILLIKIDIWQIARDVFKTARQKWVQKRD